MFNLSKLVLKSDPNRSKKEKSNDGDKKKPLKVNSANSQSFTNSGSHTNASKKGISEKHNINEDIYVLNYKRESAFFTQDSDVSSELISTINNALKTVQTRSTCFDMLEISIDGCNADKLSKHINHWMTSLVNSFTTASSQHEKEMSCKLLVKLIPKLQPTQESNQLLVTLTNHIIGKTITEDIVKNDSCLSLKVELLKEFLTCLPSLCGQHKGKYDKFFNILLTHPDPAIQETSAQCLAMIPCTGGTGSSGQAHQESWTLSFEKVLKELSTLLTSLEIELTGKSSKGNKNVYYGFVHKVTGLVKTLGALLQQSQVKRFESKQVFDVIDQLLNIKLFSGSVRPYILQLHQLAFYLLETLLSRYCELVSFNSSVIYDHMNQVLRDTSRKTTEEKPKFCTLRKSVYACLRLCFIHNIFPLSMTSLTNIIKASVKDCIFPVELASASTAIASKMKISAMSHDAYSNRKKRKNQHFDPLSDDHSHRGCKTGSSHEEIGMCVAALEALCALTTCDSKLLHLSILTEDKAVYPAVPSEESKLESIMNAVVMPIWRFIIPQVRKLQGLWSANPLSVSSDLGVYASSEVKKALFQLISALTSLPLLRNTAAFNAACNLIRAGSNSRSEPEVQQLCRQTLQWLSFTLDHDRHLKKQASASIAEDANTGMKMETEELDEENIHATFEGDFVEQHSVEEDSNENIEESVNAEEIREEGNVKPVEESVDIDQVVAEKIEDVQSEADVIHGDDDVDDVIDDEEEEEEVLTEETQDDSNKNVDLETKPSPAKPEKRKLDLVDDESDAKRCKVGDVNVAKVEAEQVEKKDPQDIIDVQAIASTFNDTWL